MGSDITTRFHIGENIGAAEGVNRLFRVANQQQGRIRLATPDAAEDTILLRVGILELIDHRHRKTLTNSAGQRFAAVAAQRVVKAAEHVVKAQFASTPLFAGDRFTDLHHRPGDNQIV